MRPAALLSPLIPALLIAIACDEPTGRSSHAPPCPEGALDQPARTDAIVALLGSVPEGAALLEATRARMGRVCFAPEGPNAIDADLTLVLDRALSDGEAAARVGHLLVHVRDGLPYVDAPPGTDCDARVAHALDREAEAHAVELELRSALGVGGSRLVFPFEAAFQSAPSHERVALVRRWLEEHPDGAPGLDGLATGYRMRCERERAGAP